MADAAVVFDRVWKKFRRGERHDSLRDFIPALGRRLVRKRRPSELETTHEFWALQDVTFDVARGQALGVIGPNGAGKSTTLKLLTRILRPTRGQCQVKGRIGALIEVAAGFHPDLTGRENIYLQGAVMGMRGAEVTRHFDEIVEFAGVGDFIDTPVKRYSSGMNARLGFSIAAHLEPDVLIIDEVLSVGDAAFQRRCLERMYSFRERGTTIVFVSHDLQAISRLCHRVLYLNRATKALGEPGEVLAAYLRDSVGTSAPDPSSPVAFLKSVLVDTTDTPVSSVSPGMDLVVRIACEVRRPIPDVTLGLILYRSTDNLIVYEGNVVAEAARFDSAQIGPHSIDFAFRANVIKGQYHIEVYALHTPTHKYVSRISPAAMFTVSDDDTCRGVADIRLRAIAREPAVS